MEKELLALVQKNLPELAASQFAEYFKASKETEKELKDALKQNEVDTKTIEAVRKDNELLKTENAALTIVNNSWNSRSENIETREKAQYIKDKDHEIELLRKDVSAHQSISSSISDFMKMIFNNTIVRENITKNVVVKNSDYTQDNYTNTGTEKVVVGGGEHVETVTDTKTTGKE